MESLKVLLRDLECISLADISALPESNQHIIAEHLEELQDELKEALNKERQYNTAHC
ncbi:hypothetical protein [Marinomonas aquiplantarum]|uniref:Uncharacterized protein n=1 Tax=Marinomonas aquiplantarum TaxID=491951 RepID=A0A366CXU7_9GAMM|nr:hypothetical protein [Marinomonas aquiplantarum]RBO82662.1 hypothetical protein DFP76_105131 [Marinomonas aquiplantarum]